MKTRRVVVSMEVETDLPLKHLAREMKERNYLISKETTDLYPGSFIVVLQAQANVIRKCNNTGTM